MGKGRIWKLAICLLLVVTILALSFTVFADDVSPTPTPSLPPINDGLNFDPLMEINYRNAMWMIYNCMRAWGIEVEYNGYREFGDEISDILEGWVFEFLESLPSQYTISTWIAPWQADMDYWGNSRYNQSALDDIQEFVDWLCNKFGLTDNSTTTIESTKVLNNVTLYYLGTYYPVIKSSSPYYDGTFVRMGEDVFHQGNSNTIQAPAYYFYTLAPDGNGRLIYRVCVITGASYVNGHIAANYYYPDHLEPNTSLSSYATWDFNITNYSNGWYYPTNRTDNSFTAARPIGCAALRIYSDTLEGYNQEIANWLNGIIYTGNGFEVVTQVIETPDDNPDYEPGDSIIIIDGSPVYVDIEWPDSITVDNLPAVISPTTISDPDLNSVYQEITPFFRTFGGAIAMVRGIVLQLPVEVISCLFALMGAIIIFGIIKIMREH